ncbi:MAG TPA: hypothetical protein VIP77_15925 [Jiangellaceae bacterium]
MSAWTPEDVERAAAAAAGVAWSSWDEYRDSFPAMAAEARRIGKLVVAALAEAGRLRETGAREQWRVSATSPAGGRTYRYTVDTEATARADVAEAPRWRCSIERRWVGPWLPVEATDTPPAHTPGDEQ